MDLTTASYKLRSKLFQWKKDQEGALSLVVGGIVALTKYKEHTIVSFPWSESWPTAHAGKWQGQG